MPPLDEALLVGLHKGQPNGVAELDGAGLVPVGQLPAASGIGGQPADATLTALAALDATLGLVEQNGVDSFTKRAIGAGAATSIPTRADGDARWARTIQFLDDPLAVTADANLTGHLPTLGGAWAKKAGYTGDLVGAVGGASVRQEGAAESVYENATVPATADVRVRGTCRVVAAPTDTAKVGIVARSQSGADTYLAALLTYWQPSAAWFLEVFEKVAGVYANIGFAALGTIAPGTDLAIEMRARGDRVAVLVDGEPLVRGTTSIAAAGAVGLYGYNEDTVDEGDLTIGATWAEDNRTQSSPEQVDVDQIAGFPDEVAAVPRVAHDPTVVEDDLELTAGDPLAGREIDRGGTWEKQTGHTGDIVGTAGNDGVRADSAGTSVYRTTEVAETSAAFVRARVDFKTAPIVGAVAAGVTLAAADAANTFYAAFFEWDGSDLWIVLGKMEAGSWTELGREYVDGAWPTDSGNDIQLRATSGDYLEVFLYGGAWRALREWNNDLDPEGGSAGPYFELDSATDKACIEVSEVVLVDGRTEVPVHKVATSDVLNFAGEVRGTIAETGQIDPGDEVTCSSTTPTSVGLVAWVDEAYTIHEVEACVLYKASVTTVGPKIEAVLANPVLCFLDVSIPIAAEGVDAFHQGQIRASAGTVTAAATPTADPDIYMVQIRGKVVVSDGGNLELNVGIDDAGGSPSIEVLAGSYLSVKRFN